jgi:hypothetical protein
VVSEKRATESADKFWTGIPHAKTRKNVHINKFPETLSCEL